MKRFFLLLLLWGWHLTAAAGLTIEITEGAEGALPIAVVPFGGSSPEDIAAIVASDLKRSGRFRPLPTADMLARPRAKAEVDFRDVAQFDPWRVRDHQFCPAILNGLSDLPTNDGVAFRRIGPDDKEHLFVGVVGVVVGPPPRVCSQPLLVYLLMSPLEAFQVLSDLSCTCCCCCCLSRTYSLF